MARRRVAVIIPKTFLVLCPYCQAEQPTEREGSFIWEEEQIKSTGGKCSDCGKEFSSARRSK